MKVVVSNAVAEFFAEDAATRHNAVLFRNTVYVGCPRHRDALNLIFDGMSHLTQWNVANRIADGKEKLLFGTALGDGSAWEHHAEYQAARMIMYGFD